MKHLIFSILLSLLLSGCKNKIPTASVTKPSYEKGWTNLEQENKSLSFDANVKLSAAERVLDEKLLRLRSQIVEQAKQQRVNLDNRTFNEIRQFIEAGKLYEILKRMPKGGLLHSHSGGLTDMKWVIEAAKKYKECYVFDRSNSTTYLFGQLAFFEEGRVPEGFVSLQKKTLQEPAFESQLYELLTLSRSTLSSKIDYWTEFEKRFQRMGLLLAYRPFFKEYYQKAIYDLAGDNVQHLEIRFIFKTLYDFAYTEYPVETPVTDLQEIVKEIQKTKPQFSLKLIYTSLKFFDVQQVQQQLETAFQLRQKFPEIISGFDLVADEATGNSISYFRENWFSLAELSRKYGVDMPLFLHAGESNSVYNKNIIDVTLLNNQRVGHGLNLIYFPQAMKRIKEQNELVEVSPISNQTLGYVSDMRNHPARTLLRHGIQCSINSDDPGVFGYEGLSYDFWMIYMYWELDLKAMKKLVFNSINYSSLNDNEKKAALNYLEKEWTFFVEKANREIKVNAVEDNTTNKKRKIIIDTDTASDDAVALLMALNNPTIAVEAITVVAGNVPLEQGVQNAMYTLKLCKGSAPVFKGMDKPLVRILKTAEYVHGKDGMSDIGLPLRGFIPQSKHAVVELVDRINQAKEEITLVCLGPLTNIAMALLLDKSMAQKVKSCVIMGGVGLGRGNVTPVSEYNFWADPEAAKIVFESGMPIKMVGWDISREYAVFDEIETQKVKSINTPLAHFAIDIQKSTAEFCKKTSGLKGFDLPDPIAMAVALDNTVATETKQAFVSILTNDDDSRGQSVMDYTGATGKKPNAEVVLKADSEKFRQMLREACKAK